jgi:peptidoglycan/xylan/chitin deacetylase (PgdA/CDA1 family)
MLTGKGGVLLTFDDGFANNYTNALPVLKEFNAPAVFFVSTQHVIDPRDWLPATRQMAVAGWRNEQSVPREIAADLYDGLSTEELAECAQCPLITIGSHTVSHPFLSRCVPDKLSFELQESKRLLENISGQTVELFAYPTGDYNQAVADAVGSAGYRTAFALDTRRVTVSRLEIPRVGIYASDAPYLGLKLSGLYHRALLGQPAEVAVG